MKANEYREKEDFILLKENVELKIGMVKNTIERMSLDCFTKAYLDNYNFYRLIKFIDQDLSKVFESLLHDMKTEVQYMEIARKELEDFVKVKKWEAENKVKVN